MLIIPGGLISFYMNWFYEEKGSQFMRYWLAKIEDIDDVCILINNAIREMESHGIFQWDALYPTREDILEDIDKKSLFLALEENMIAAMYVISGESDEAYNSGSWNCADETSYVLHRFVIY